MTVQQLLTVAPYDPESAPPPDVVDVMERGLVEVVRRVEIYQSDATTRWNPNNPDPEVIRLVEGNVTVDYNSDERRKLDLTLENIDQKLRPNPNGGLWYDKVIKVFRGVRYAAGDAKATVAIIEAQDGLSGANRLRQVLSSMGYDVTILLGETDVADLRDYQFIVSFLSVSPTRNASLLAALFEQGKNVLTVGVGSGAAELPHYSATPSPANFIPAGAQSASVIGAGGWAAAPWGGCVAYLNQTSPIEGDASVTIEVTSTPNVGVLRAVIQDRWNVPAVGTRVYASLRVRNDTTSQKSYQLYGEVFGPTGTYLNSPRFVSFNLEAGETRTVYGSYLVPSGLAETPTTANFMIQQLGAVIGDKFTVDQGYVHTTDPTTQYGVSPTGGDSAVAGAFGTQAAGTPTPGTRPTGTAVGAQALAVYPSASSPNIVTAAIVRNSNRGMWIDIHLPSVYDAEPRNLLRASLDYMRFIEPYKTWETQLGEFYIDGITTPNFPNQVKITARDGTKKLINDKLPKNSTFPVGTSLRDFVRNMASLGGIPLSKMRFNIGSETLTTEMSFERGTSRWDMIKSALESFGYERFFDGFGNFVVRKYIDPTTGPISMEFGTGPEGNLVTFEKAISDSRIYNHVIVTSPPSDDESNPVGYFGEAYVTDVNLPTHKSRIGNRVWPIDAPWLGSDLDCYELAAERLKITALESYTLNFSSIYYPWLEAGEIISIDDPDAFDFEPDRFLMDSIAYPLTLGPMSATGKRITYVGSSGAPAEIPVEGEQ